MKHTYSPISSYMLKCAEFHVRLWPWYFSQMSLSSILLSFSGIIPLDILKHFWKGSNNTSQYYKLFSTSARVMFFLCPIFLFEWLANRVLEILVWKIFNLLFCYQSNRRTRRYTFLIYTWFSKNSC